VADFIAGLDLGQVADYSAFTVVRRRLALDPAGEMLRNARGDEQYEFVVAHLERYELGTTYADMVKRTVKLIERPQLWIAPDVLPWLAIDATGCGRPVLEMFVNARPRASIRAVTITGGAAEATLEGWPNSGVLGYHVNKTELVSTVQSLLQSGRLKVSSKLPDAELLKRELLNFQIKITASAHETFNAREGQHDDLVLAVALACWLGGRREIPFHASEDGPPRDGAILINERAEEEARERAALRSRREAEEAEIERQHRRIDNPLWWPPLRLDE
jgi:hypothetical protein